MTHVQKFKDELSDMLSELNSIPYLNRGGCAIAALAIKKHIIHFYTSKSSHNYKWKVDVVYLGDGYAQNNRAKKDQDDPISCSHAMVRVGIPGHGTLYIDSNSMYKNWHAFDDKEVIMPDKLTVESINERWTWNDDFNRRYVGDIAEICMISLWNIKMAGYSYSLNYDDDDEW